MKRIILIIGVFLTSYHFLHAQYDAISVSYQSTENNTYKYEYYNTRTGTEKVLVSNIQDPFEGQPGVELSYRFFTKVTSPAKTLADIVYEYLDPYLPIRIRGGEQSLFITLKIGIDGMVGHVSFIHPKSISFPVEAYEAVETGIKNEYKLVFEYDPNKIEGIYTIYDSIYSLNDMAEEQFDVFQPENPGQGPTNPRPIDTNPGQ